jgi:hypothetical protein
MIIVHEPSGPHVSGRGQYKPNVCHSTNRGSLSRSFTPSKPGDAVTGINPSGDALTSVASTLLNAKAVSLEGASLIPKQVHAFCDHVELVIRARVYDEQTFTLLTDSQSIMAIGPSTRASPSWNACQSRRKSAILRYGAASKSSRGFLTALCNGPPIGQIVKRSISIPFRHQCHYHSIRLNNLCITPASLTAARWPQA